MTESLLKSKLLAELAGVWAISPFQSWRASDIMRVCTHLILAILLVSGAPSTSPSSEISIEELINKCDEAMSSFHQFSVKARMKRAFGDEELRSSHEFEWRIVGPVESIQSKSYELEQDPNGAWHEIVYYNSFYNGKDEFRQIVGWNPENPPHLSKSDNGGVDGLISRRKERFWNMYPRARLGLGLYHPDRKVVSLSQFLDRATSMQLELPMNADEPFVISADLPDGKGRYGISAAHGFMLAFLEFSGIDGRKSKMTFVDWYSLEENLFLPKRVETIDETPDGLRIRSELEIELLALNENVAEEDLVLQFPEWMVVMDEETGEYLVWGADGPKERFPNLEAYSLWYTPDAIEARGPSTWSTIHFILIGITGIILLSGVVFALKRRTADNLPS